MTSALEQPQRLVELQSSLGKALWEIQAFEDTLAHLIAAVRKLPARASLEEAEAILEKVQGNTLGGLIAETKKVVHFDASFEPFMHRFLRERNWLVHRSWRAYHGYLHKPDEYTVLISRVRRLASDARELNELFFGFLQSWAKARGVPQSEIERIEKEFLDVWQDET